VVSPPHGPSPEASAAVARALRRIRRDEAAIGAFALVAAEASRIDARAVDASGGSQPLRGTTLGVKDIIDVAGLPTRCGAPAVTDPGPAPTDATVVARLRTAGAVVIGKTTTAAFAYFDPPPTRNPWDLRRTPGGSSAGSAAAVAAGMADLALGTQTAGSLIRPASFCGLAAVLPSPGRIPRDGVRLLSPTFDRVGVMAATLELALAAIGAAGDGPRSVSPARPGVPRLGVAGWLLDEAEPPMRMAVERVIAAARRAGAMILPVPAPRPLDAVLAAHATILCGEAAAIHGDALEVVGAAYPPRLAELVRIGLATPPTELAAARRFRRDYTARLAAALEPVDALLAPAAVGVAPLGLGGTGDPRMSVPGMVAGLPAIGLPLARDPNGLPLGVQVLGRPGDDAGLAAAAAWLVAAAGAPRGRPPQAARGST
jgi:Asp-tRNA(Asn)/Glu-tRNA(Gln) amidotransferase A subunit family amidase